jgi:hypothetical protein
MFDLEAAGSGIFENLARIARSSEVSGTDSSSHAQYDVPKSGDIHLLSHIRR